MEECVKDNLHDALGGLKDYRSALGKANDTMNDAIGAISRLERENKSLRDELEELRGQDTSTEVKNEHFDALGKQLEVGDTVVIARQNIGHGERPCTYRIAGFDGKVANVVDTDSGFGWKIPADSLLYWGREFDSWEQLHSDLSEHDSLSYCNCILKIDVTSTTYEEDRAAMATDVIRRAKRLAGVEND